MLMWFHSTVSSFDCRMVATPLASLLGVKETVRLKAPHHPTLESYYCYITKNPTKVDAKEPVCMKLLVFGN